MLQMQQIKSIDHAPDVSISDATDASSALSWHGADEPLMHLKSAARSDACTYSTYSVRILPLFVAPNCLAALAPFIVNYRYFISFLLGRHFSLQILYQAYRKTIIVLLLLLT